MSAPPVHYVDVRAFCYATEVAERVEAALRAVHPGLDGPGEVTIERTSTEGHFGHPIDVLEARLSTADQVGTVFARLHAHGVLDRLAAELPERLTGDNELFVRVDKQTAYTDDRLVPGEGIELRAKVEAYPAKRAIARENLEAYLADLDGGR